ncbi:MAG: ACT domain-containing protein [Gemmataceae bacterium]|nr:ACT domain-containing protein [Gemmataceae bacterium]
MTPTDPRRPGPADALSLPGPTAPHALALVPLAGRYAVCRLAPGSPVPGWAAGEFVSVTRTPDELSVVCPAAAVPGGVACEPGWHGWRLAGTFDLTTAVGVLAAVLGPLADAGVGVFTLSTFDTDYLFVKAGSAARAAEALRRAGHTVPDGAVA